MATNKQSSITLDQYHLWAIDRIAAAMRTSRSDLISWAVREWIGKYPEMVKGAAATLHDFSGVQQ